MTDESSAKVGPDKDQVTSTETSEDLWGLALSSQSDNSLPTKSSNEILTELFGAFNAEPPKSPIPSDCDTDEPENEGKSKKRKKKRKKEKKHKKKKHKRRLSGEQDDSSVGYSSDSEADNGKRKEKKHKRKKKSRQKGSDGESDGDQKHKKRARRNSKSPVVVVKSEPNATPEAETNVVSSSTMPSSPPSPPIPPSKEDDSKKEPIFDAPESVDATADKSDKNKPAAGKIVIKDLKFSTVFEATVKEVEEQAKAKAEKYEEGELSDSSTSQKSSDLSLSDDPCNEASLGSEGGEAVEPKAETDDHHKRSKRSHSKEKSSSHKKKSRHRSRSKDRDRRSKDRDKDKHSHSHSHSHSHNHGHGYGHSHSHSKVKDKEVNRHKDRDKDKEREKDKEKDKDRDRDRAKDKDKDKDRERDKGKDRDRDRDKERDRDRERDRDHKERDRRHGRSRSRSSHGSRRRSSSRSRRRHSRDRHSRERHRSRSRSRDRKRSSGTDHIDKKKLLEIARRNAMNMLQAGILPATIMGKPAATTTTSSSSVAQAPKPEKNAAKTVDELTEYCKELSKRENLGELSSLSGSDDSDTEKPFHHPFQVKDRPSFISLNIKNSVPLPLKTPLERTAEQSTLRIQFPVSSGQQHRKNESEWVPVIPQKKPEPSNEKRGSSALKAIEAPPPPAETKPKPTGEIVDIGTLVSQRLSAMRQKHDSQQTQENIFANHMHGWKNVLPGQYTGDTGLRLLTPQQLASGAQAWARKDQLQTATPVRSGMGMTLLQKMGWRPGEGLGKNKEGCQVPLQLEVKMDRKGLVAAEEIRSRRPPPTVMAAPKPKPPVTLEGKHPVSLLTEYCSKRHFGAPHFELCLESGPDHKKDFLFKVRVNGLEYQSNKASPNKKQAKAEAASVCLKALGVLIG